MGGSFTLNTRIAFGNDLAGRMTSMTNALFGVTSYVETTDSATGERTRTTTNPDNGTRVETFYRDGSLEKVTGTAAMGVRYEYGADTAGAAYTKEIKLNGDTDTAEWTKAYTDMLGRPRKTLYAAGSGTPVSLSYYNAQGQLTNQVDPDGVSLLFGYNAKGEQTYSIVDSNRNYQIDWSGASADRITLVTNDVVNDNGSPVRRTRTFVWAGSGNTPTPVTTEEASVDGLQTWSTVWNNGAATTRHSQSFYDAAHGLRVITSTAPDNSFSVTTNQYGRLISMTQKDSTGAPIGQTVYGYDAHGRRSTATDARTGATTWTYQNNSDLVGSVTTPNPGTLGGGPQTTTTFYNNMLQATNVVQPDGASVISEYYPTGQLKRQYGSRTYPVGYSYDYAGRVLTMTNWTSFPSTGARVTTWNYNSYRGWLASKTYDGNTTGPAYTYTDGGRLHTRHWARGITTTYTYDNAGGLATVSYDDGTTPGQSYTYDRRGRQATVTQNGITDTLTYNDANLPLGEAYTSGLLGGLSVTNGYDQYLRHNTLSLANGQTTLQTINYGYDNASRLLSVTDNTGSPAYSATYSYLANSPLVSQILFKQATTPRMTTTKQYDYLNRLSSVSSSSSPSISSSYAYNSANQRIRSSLADGSYWLYTYDPLGQVVAGIKYWPDGTPVAGQQFDYTFDTIGNRTQTQAGGDQNGANLRSASYSADNLNRYSSRDVPGAVDVMGLGFATNAVTVNNQAAYRKGEYFRAQVSVSNGSTSVWQSVSIAATNQNTISGNVFVPKNQEQFSYDLDGNLTNDGRWTYTWDAENRLVKLAPNTSIGPRNSLQFEYDWKGRRIHKQVWSNALWSGTPTNDVKFVYDGWNLLAELNATNNALIRSFVWGSDLSGTVQGAGGVGGLLFIGDLSSGIGYCAPAFDGNGNVATLVSMSGGTNCATYDYGPFGELLRGTGPMAKLNPFRFSSKYQDDETDLLYYGYRYYNASTGRWINRDPIAERGGKNLYCFVRNGPQSFHDILGRSSSKAIGFKWQDGTSIEVSASLDASNPDEPCLGGFLKFNVHIEANTPPDRSYMSQARFSFGSTDVPYTDYGAGREGWVNFDVPYTKALPGCPVGKQSGVDIFKGIQAYGSDIEGGLSITFNWTYTCDECCNTRKPLAVSFDFSPFGSLEWPKAR